MHLLPNAVFILLFSLISSSLMQLQDFSYIPGSLAGQHHLLNESFLLYPASNIILGPNPTSTLLVPLFILPMPSKKKNLISLHSFLISCSSNFLHINCYFWNLLLSVAQSDHLIFFLPPSIFILSLKTKFTTSTTLKYWYTILKCRHFLNILGKYAAKLAKQCTLGWNC